MIQFVVVSVVLSVKMKIPLDGLSVQGDFLKFVIFIF